MNIDEYFQEIDAKVKSAYALANKAKSVGFDPEDNVEVPLAKNMAERVIGLVSAMAPQIANKGIPERIAELESKYGILDWRVALIIAEEVANEKFCKFDNEITAIEIGIRVGFAYITLGTVASPLEGFDQIKVRKRADGKDYFALFYAGPIRSAGGTGASVSVIIADYIRKKKGYDVYDPTQQEIQRMITEITDYHEHIANLQYYPSEEELEFLLKNLPVQIDGDPSEEIEVSNYKDVKRIETNSLRNGPCLVLCECLAQKAPKLWKNLSKWGKDFGLEHWFFLEEFLNIQKNKKAKGQIEKTKQKIAPDYTFIKDLVAGRPVLTYPLREGGFRLRYGRCRTSGYSSTAIHPATMRCLNSYIAVGTQLKIERPGKATSLTVCDSIEGPIVKLKDGTVLQITNELEAKQHINNISEILFLGDILINYGDFFNRAHPLVPAGYCEEHWALELEHAIVDAFGALDFEKASELLEIPSETIHQFVKDKFKTIPSAYESIIISKKLGIPMHPKWEFHWKSINTQQLLRIMEWLSAAKRIHENKLLHKIILPLKEEPKRALELIGMPHLVVNKEFVVIEKDYAQSIEAALNIETPEETIAKIKSNQEKSVLEIINLISKIKHADKSGTAIGARMGRPEKAKLRKLTGSPHTLFPVGEEGGKQRSFQTALEQGVVTADFPTYLCEKCNKQTVFRVCDKCLTKTKKMYFCKSCGFIEQQECKHGVAQVYENKPIDIKYYFDSALNLLGITAYPELIKGVRGTSNKEHIPEHLAKGILRAIHSLYVNKDGTIRYDMTQIGITHFKPKEIGVSIEKLKELGYTHDITNKPLENSEQILEIFPQDVILPACDSSPDEGADKIALRTAQFIDDLLVRFYKQEPFYNANSPKELIGHLIIALAPHTSAGIIGRIIGFSQTQGFYAHPMFHAAQRRDLDGDESCFVLLMDVLLNFSKKYLPAHKGSTQDAPFVITSRLIPSEIDDMVFDMDRTWGYPLEFYNAAQNYSQPWEVQIPQFKSVLGKAEQYYGFGFTHPVSDINMGVHCSVYKTLPSMEDKLKGQMELAEKIRAVDASDIARLVIEKHFIRDIKGNLRKFSTQEFRCVKCNEKFRRPPLVGKCHCGGRIIFTVSEGTILKYLGPSISLANNYNVPNYLKQSLELVKRRIEGIFGKEKEKQTGLGAWFG